MLNTPRIPQTASTLPSSSTPATRISELKKALAHGIPDSFDLNASPDAKTNLRKSTSIP
jgi:hypothetical protein